MGKETAACGREEGGGGRKRRGIFCGTGQFARVQMGGWREVRGGGIVGVYGRRGEAARSLAGEYGVGAHGDDLGRMLAETGADFVDICTAVEAHGEQVRVAAEAGVAVLCQKPLAGTMEEARELVEVCRAAGVALMVNDNWRWQPWYREVKGLVEAGVLGEVRSVYQTLRTGDGWEAEPYGEQPYFRRMERFLLLETGIHYVDTYRYLFGEPQRVQAMIRRNHEGIAGEDQAVVTLDFGAGGPLVVWDGNRAVPTRRRKPPFNGVMKVEGTEGELTVDEDGRMVVTPRGGEAREHVYRIPAGYRGGSVTAALEHFCAGLEAGGVFETSGEGYLKTMELVFAAYASAESGQAVEVAR